MPFLKYILIFFYFGMEFWNLFGIFYRWRIYHYKIFYNKRNIFLKIFEANFRLKKDKSILVTFQSFVATYR